MSKVHEKDTGILNSLTHSGIADELESRLRELERNIAVAREFIKLADESYSELRHKWNILQQEGKDKTNTEPPEPTTTQHRKTEERPKPKEHGKTKTKTGTDTTLSETETSDDSDDIPTFPMHRPHPEKTSTGTKKTETSTETSGQSAKKTTRSNKSKKNR